MKRPEFTDGEKFFLDSHNFQLYDDSVLQSIKAWDTGRDQWSKDIWTVRQAGSADVFELREAELALAQNHYAEAFAQAAATVAADGNVPERIVPALDGLIRTEDARRREQLRYMQVNSTITEPSEEYIYDLAMAFGDPQGMTLLPDSPYVVFDQNTATEYFASRLAQHEALLLDNLRISHERHIATQTKRGLGNTATRFVRRFINRQGE